MRLLGYGKMFAAAEDQAWTFSQTALASYTMQAAMHRNQGRSLLKLAGNSFAAFNCCVELAVLEIREGNRSAGQKNGGDQDTSEHGKDR